jgi:hypothetical protein
MSLEQSIANLQEQAGLLLDLPQQVTDTATVQIDRIGDAYVNHINKLVQTFYVSNTGDDTQSGLTSDAPLATLNKAIDLTPVGGVTNIRLMSDIHMSEDAVVRGKSINIISDGSVRHRISFEHYEVVSNTNDFSRIRSFEITDGGGVSIRTLTLVLPHSDGNFANNIYGTNSSIFQASPSNIAAASLTRAAVIDCNIERPLNSKITVASTSQGGLVLATRSIIETDQPVAGFWVVGVPAGTDPATLSNILTNLPSL